MHLACHQKHIIIKTQTRTHAHESILSKIIFFKSLFEQDFRWSIANKKGEIVPIVSSNDGRAKLSNITTDSRVIVLSCLFYIVDARDKGCTHWFSVRVSSGENVSKLWRNHKVSQVLQVGLNNEYWYIKLIIISLVSLRTGICCWKKNCWPWLKKFITNLNWGMFSLRRNIRTQNWWLIHLSVFIILIQFLGFKGTL